MNIKIKWILGVVVIYALLNVYNVASAEYIPYGDPRYKMNKAIEELESKVDKLERLVDDLVHKARNHKYYDH